MLFMLHFLERSDVFFDIGANAGSYSILAAGICESKVYSFEPVLQARLRLEENLNLNGLSTKYIQSCALGSFQGKIQLTKSLDAMNHVVRNPKDISSESVEMQTLDSFALVAGVALMKIDVEGYEMEILRGGKGFLRNPFLKALIIETNGETEHYGSTNLEIEMFLYNFGFKPFRYDATTRNLTPLKGVNSIGNTIFVRDLDDVAARLHNGLKISIHDDVF